MSPQGHADNVGTSKRTGAEQVSRLIKKQENNLSRIQSQLNCYSRLAQVSKDYSICWNVQDAKGKAMCMTMVSAQKASDTADNIQSEIDGKGPSVAQATYIKGDVLYQPAGGSDWLPVDSNTQFKEGDVIRVGPGSKMRYIEGIGTDQANARTIMQGTELTVKKPEIVPPKGIMQTASDLWTEMTKP